MADRRATAAKPSAPPIDREELVKELLEVRRELRAIEPKALRDKEICSLLKQDAKANGGNFKVTIDGLGFANVSAPKDKRLTGTTHELNLEVFLRLPQRDQDRMIERGTVKEVETWSGAYYGAVDVQLFP